MSRPAPTRYRTLNWSAYNSALRERGSLTVWFDPDMAWPAAPSVKRGRQQTFSDTAIQACLTIEVLLGSPLRQTTGFGASLLKLAGFDWPVPDHSTQCRRQKTLAVQLPYRGSGEPLHLLIDSTGIKARGEGEWHAGKHGGAKRRVWRKVHLAVEEATLEVRAVESSLALATGPKEPVDGSRVGDAPMLPGLLSQIPEGEPIASITADGAHDGRACRDTIARRGAEALAIVLEPMAHMARSRPGATPSRGRGTAPARERATKPCALSSASAERSGAAGADITAEAALRPR